MRSVLVAVLFAVVPVHADGPDLVPGPSVAPAPGAPKITGPNGTPDPKWQPQILPPVTLAGAVSKIPNVTADGAPSMDGGRAAGVVIEPPAHPDAEPWPYGIVMTPPEVRDRMLIVPGTNTLSSELRVATSWAKRLADTVVERASALAGLVLPRSL